MTDAFYDALQDARAELVGDAVYLSVREAVALSLHVPHGCGDLYPHMRDNARHPYGLPSSTRARPGHPAADPPPGGTTPTGLLPLSPPREQADGDLPTAA